MALRSAREFPKEPDPDLLAATYRECRAALVSANRGRGVLKALSDKRGVVIIELQRELRELEGDLSDEARAKARLHAMNSKLVGVIRELETTGDAMVTTIEKSEQQSGFWLVQMFRDLVRLARQWRQTKSRATELAADAALPPTLSSKQRSMETRADSFQNAPSEPPGPAQLPLKL